MPVARFAFVVVVWLAGSVPLADAAQLPVTTSLEGVSSARELLATLGNDVTVIQADCGSKELTSQLQQSGTWVVVTTPNCLDGLPLAGTKIFGPALGPAAYLYAIDLAPFKTRSQVLRIGMLDKDQKMDAVLKSALGTLGLQTEVKLIGGYPRLVSELAATRLDGVVVFDDGTGTARNELALAPRRAGVSATLQRVRLDRRDTAWIVDVPEGWTLAANIEPDGIFEPDVVAQTWPIDPAAKDAPLLRFSHQVARRTFGAPGAAPAPKPQSRMDRLFGRLPNPPPRLPIVVAKGVPPSRVKTLQDAVHRASLIVAVETGINPCHEDTQAAYRAFVRPAADVEPKSSPLVTPLWEHAAMRGAVHEEVHGVPAQVEAVRLASLEGVTSRAILIRNLTALAAGTECSVTDRPLFSTPKQAYYRHAMRQLQRGVQGADQAKVRDAAACMAIAVDNNEVPTCAASLSAMWTDHYAPFLAAVLIAQKVVP